MKQEIKFRWRGAWFWGRWHQMRITDRGWQCNCGAAPVRRVEDHIKSSS